LCSIPPLPLSVPWLSIRSVWRPAGEGVFFGYKISRSEYYYEQLH
jgi:hypothetical protein